jgi:starvation-inducible DNA-binding protein
MSPKSNNPVAAALAQVLADTFALQIKTQTYHWNVTGPQFHGLHIMFETQYNELFAAVDLLAERIRALGVLVDGGFEPFSKLTKVAGPQAGADARTMVKDLADSHRQVSESAKAALDIADSAGDDVTVDMLTNRREEHGKSAWMLDASL